ncbi:MAG: 4-hydroxy-tetrahydrodipicolinate reductase [Pseudomonadota bacterium]
MNSMGLTVVGAAGRMGRSLIKTVIECDGTHLAAALEREGSPDLGRDAGEIAGLGPLGVVIEDDVPGAIARGDGVLDFTTPDATCLFAAEAAKAGLVHVIGTTGLTGNQEALLAQAAGQARIVKSGNMSLGVNLLAELVRQAASALGQDFDIEVVEMHHKHKVDAPSGTAYLLGAAAADGRGIDLAEASVRVRDGQTGPRPSGTIGFATLRGGSVVGDHTIILAGDGERLELTHRAQDRSLFASGAIKAALWAKRQEPGLYSMKDVLGL